MPSQPPRPLLRSAPQPSARRNHPHTPRLQHHHCHLQSSLAHRQYTLDLLSADRQVDCPASTAHFRLPTPTFTSTARQKQPRLRLLSHLLQSGTRFRSPDRWPSQQRHGPNLTSALRYPHMSALPRTRSRHRRHPTTPLPPPPTICRGQEVLTLIRAPLPARPSRGAIPI